MVKTKQKHRMKRNETVLDCPHSFRFFSNLLFASSFTLFRMTSMADGGEGGGAMLVGSGEHLFRHFVLGQNGFGARFSG